MWKSAAHNSFLAIFGGKADWKSQWKFYFIHRIEIGAVQ
jgi:hypothetical protein